MKESKESDAKVHASQPIARLSLVQGVETYLKFRFWHYFIVCLQGLVVRSKEFKWLGNGSHGACSCPDFFPEKKNPTL